MNTRKIRKLREDRGITQAQLSEKLGVGRSAVAMWETGCAKPSADKLPKLAKLLGCTIDELYAEDKGV